MSEPGKKSASEILAVLVERVRLIERESGNVAAVMEKMIASIERQRSAAAVPSLGLEKNS